MLRLGHISYANCYPVHALLLEGAGPPDVSIVSGVPADLNAALAAGRIDAAPCSSIEYAVQGRYRVLPDLAIGSAGAVGSILLEHDVPIEALGGRTVAVPTASATSVVLLRILLARRWGVVPHFTWFDQERGPESIVRAADAVLWIGDAALRRSVAGRAATGLLDLGEAWTAWTGLPFAFALWQTHATPDREYELARLHALLLDSLDYFEQNDAELAERRAAEMGMPPDRLLAYWRALCYRLDMRMQAGLLRFYRESAELGLTPAANELRWACPPRSALV